MKTQKLGGPGRLDVVVSRAEVVRDGSTYLVRGLTADGRLVRVPLPGATLDGVAVPIPDPETQRRMAAESTVWEPGKPKPKAGDAPATAPAAAAPKGRAAK